MNTLDPDIFALLGKTNIDKKEIAAQLFITPKAVDKHANSIFTKLDLPVAPDDNRRVLAVLAWLEV